jgi:hypothetical protein
MAAVPADADTLSLLPRGNPGAHFINDACDFVSRNARILNARPQAFFREHVTVANTTGLYLDAHLSWTRLRNLALDDLEISSRFGNLRNLHWCRLWFDRDSERCHESSQFVLWCDEKRSGLDSEPVYKFEMIFVLRVLSRRLATPYSGKALLSFPKTSGKSSEAIRPFR